MNGKNRTKQHWAEWHVAYLSKWGLIREPLPLPGAILPFSAGKKILDRIAADNDIERYHRLVQRETGTATDHEQHHDLGNSTDPDSDFPQLPEQETIKFDDEVGVTRLAALRSIHSLICASSTPPPTLAELEPRLENPGPAGPVQLRPRFWDRSEIPSDCWEEVVHAEKLQIVRGYVDRTFRPKEAIRWGEFAAMLIRASYWIPSLDE